ncbi:hypothetical protein [Helicobacter turcicus]|uniref:HdrB-like C-terminal domain-containing protein n=1 Tax=Helicobacter turcicus TaxID=2867412 RepID=A0ABS7JKU8_9HELI|nr:hypothetical protein [Helicobacter turcicus]MBX7490022.1 hypothetical protein [Helicobacter turcicus]MBX7544881.1 hypothetical protein [Helicobacter turcicus]
MESCILLHNNFYKSSEFLIHNVKKLLDKLHISVVHTESIALDDKFLPFIAPMTYFKPLIALLNRAHEDGQKVLVCDSQSLLVITKLLKKLYEDAEFREELAKTCGCGIDILNLENSFAFALEVVFDAIKVAEIKHRRWEGFKCAFIFDRELEEHIKESQILSRIESITGLKILPFFKDSYAYLLQNNPELAYKMGAMDYYEMVDCGVDFIVSPNVGNFELMDRHIKKLQDISGRDTAEIPLLFAPQVILALFIDASAESLGFSAHKIKPQML